jgi:hypothetical protein
MLLLSVINFDGSNSKGGAHMPEQQGEASKMGREETNHLRTIEAWSGLTWKEVSQIKTFQIIICVLLAANFGLSLLKFILGA